MPNSPILFAAIDIEPHLNKANPLKIEIINKKLIFFD